MSASLLYLAPWLLLLVALALGHYPGERLLQAIDRARRSHPRREAPRHRPGRFPLAPRPAAASSWRWRLPAAGRRREPAARPGGSRRSKIDERKQ